MNKKPKKQDSNMPTLNQIRQLHRLLVKLGYDSQDAHIIINKNIKSKIWDKQNIEEIITKAKNKNHIEIMISPLHNKTRILTAIRKNATKMVQQKKYKTILKDFIDNFQ